MEVVWPPLCNTIVTVKSLSYKQQPPLHFPQKPNFSSSLKHYPSLAFCANLSSLSRFSPPVLSATQEDQLSVGENTDTSEWALQEERSQLANKLRALSRLKAKLLVIAEEQRASEIKQIRGDAVKAEWGQQIRNYVFHPYKLVKDVRTGYETPDITSVMDGELDPFIKSYLKHKYNMALSTSGAN